MKHAKKAFVASLFATLLCVSMLVGSTFAWFTDSVTSAGNIIKSGTLDIDLLAKGGETGYTEYTSLGTEHTPVFNYTLWEPGYTSWANVKVENKGSLALKYTMTITAKGANGDAIAAAAIKLAEVIDVYYKASEVAKPASRDLSGLTKIGTLAEVLAGGGAVTVNDNMLAGASDFATIALHMQETAGNEYQNLSVGTSFDIMIVATQYTYESDSFNDQYDVNAEYPEN